MNKKRKLLLAIAGALGVFIVGAGIYLAYTGSRTRMYNAQITEAQGYLLAGDFENAAIAYQKAINMDSSKSAGYTGLAQAYYSQGFTQLAATTLEQGIAKVQNKSSMQNLLNVYIGKGDTGKKTLIDDNKGTAAPEPESAAESETESEETKNVKLMGNVYDAQTNEPVMNVSLDFYEGDEDGDSAGSTSTDSYGYYSLDLPAGTYAFVASCNGYENYTGSVSLDENADDQTLNMIITKQLDGEIRIVLTWNEEPQDLDSYLTGTDSEGSNVYVFFGNRGGSDGAAELDIDEMDGYGPETITVHDTAGAYNYTVRDYRRTGQMGTLGATVEVYLPDGTTQTFNVPAGENINVWNVFTLNNGQIQAVNTVS